MASKENATRGIVSLGISPLRKINGNAQIMSRMKKGKIERGATNAPDMDENSGKEVKGRQIKAIAQRTSQTLSKLFPNLVDVSIMQSF